MSTLELFSYLFGIPNVDSMLLSQNLIGHSLLSQEYGRLVGSLSVRPTLAPLAIPRLNIEIKNIWVQPGLEPTTL